MTEITASLDSLFKQASMTASEYMREAVVRIDRTFGPSYAAKHPQLVVAFMQVACADFVAASTAKVLGEALEELAHAVRGLG